MSMCAVRASPPDLLKIVKTDDVTRNAGQQPECPGYGRRERRRARFFFPCGLCFSARHATGRDGRRQGMCGDMALRLRDAWRGVEDIVPAPESGRPPPCTAQATAGASRLLRPPCAGTAWPPCMRWQRRQSWIVNRPEYGRKHWPGRKGRAEGQGADPGRAVVRRPGRRLPARMHRRSEERAVMPKARMLSRVSQGASLRGRGGSGALAGAAR